MVLPHLLISQASNEARLSCRLHSLSKSTYSTERVYTLVDLAVNPLVP